MPSLLELEEKFEALQRRLWPLEQKETGINGVLKALTESRTRLAATIARLELDEGVALSNRIQQLLNTPVVTPVMCLFGERRDSLFVSPPK